jgi:CheY-like chemotaxis protein
VQLSASPRGELGSDCGNGDRVDSNERISIHYLRQFAAREFAPHPCESRVIPSRMPVLRILVVDDHESVRKGVCAILSSRSDLEVCGEAVDGNDAIAKVSCLRPHIIIMDISMPGLDGMSASRQILKMFPDMSVIILSMHDSKQLIETARKTGIHGFVTKGQAGSVLLDAVGAVAKGQTFFPS